MQYLNKHYLISSLLSYVSIDVWPYACLFSSDCFGHLSQRFNLSHLPQIALRFNVKKEASQRIIRLLDAQMT